MWCKGFPPGLRKRLAGYMQAHSEVAYLSSKRQLTCYAEGRGSHAQHLLLSWCDADVSIHVVVVWALRVQMSWTATHSLMLFNHRHWEDNTSQRSDGCYTRVMKLLRLIRAAMMLRGTSCLQDCHAKRPAAAAVLAMC